MAQIYPNSWNLFHSFGQFSLATQESATFSGPPGIQAVFSRVTGGQASTIDGTIRSTLPGADLYLINPAGVMFGPQGRLDVPGAFYATTATGVRFTDGMTFGASPLANGGLTSAPPAAFGFLGTPAQIQVTGSQLAVTPGQTLALAGGNIRIDTATLLAEGGTLALWGQGGAGEVGLNLSAQPSIGSPVMISLSYLSTTTTGSRGGVVRLRGGDLTITDSLLATGAVGAGQSWQALDLTANGVLQLQGSMLTSSAIRGGQAGDIQLSGRQVFLNQAASLNANCLAGGACSQIRIQGGELVSIEGGNGTWPDGSIKVGGLYASSGSDARGGLIRIEAPRIEITNGTVATRTQDGPGGSIEIAAEQLHLTNTGLNTVSTGAGRGGDIRLSGSGEMLLQDSNIATDAQQTGDAGNLSITTGQLLMQGGSLTSTTDQSRAGEIRIRGDSLRFTEGAALDAGTWGSGAGGLIQVDASQELTLAGGDEDKKNVYFTVGTYGSGPAGAIALSAPSLSTLKAFITAETWGAGKGGDIRLTGDDIRLDSGTFVTTLTDGSGNCGAVTIEAKRSVWMKGPDSFVATTSHENSTGSAGDVSIQTPWLRIEGGLIAAAAGGATGDAGNIHIAVNRLEMGSGAALSSHHLAGLRQ
ncbi:hypothetical protein CCP4SC76_6320001 [Gammaproteobacteria bacterium]